MNFKKFMCGVSAAACALTLSVPALAVESRPEVTDVHAVLWPEPIYVDEEPARCWDGAGYERTPINYNGTVYIPLRSAGMWMETLVSWDQNTQTAALTTPAGQDFNAQVQPFGKKDTEEMLAQHALDLEQGITAQLRPDLTVTLDGQVQHFTNAADETVYPLFFRDCIYLPVRSVGELMGRQVLYQSGDSPSIRLCAQTDTPHSADPYYFGVDWSLVDTSMCVSGTDYHRSSQDPAAPPAPASRNIFIGWVRGVPAGVPAGITQAALVTELTFQEGEQGTVTLTFTDSQDADKSNLNVLLYDKTDHLISDYVTLSYDAAAPAARSFHVDPTHAYDISITHQGTGFHALRLAVDAG